jgi:DNA-directed RNA polymerase specialized sigma24 family protein
LAWLEPSQARVLQLVVLEGMSLRQTAKLMQSNASAVRRQLKAGLAELRTRLSPASDVAGC